MNFLNEGVYIFLISLFSKEIIKQNEKYFYVDKISNNEKNLNSLRKLIER